MEKEMNKAAIIAGLKAAADGDVDLYEKSVKEYKNLTNKGLSEEDAFDAAAKIAADGDEERYQKALVAFSEFFIEVEDLDKPEPEAIEETPEQSEEDLIEGEDIEDESDEEYSTRIAKKQEKRNRLLNRVLIIGGGLLVVVLLALIVTYFLPNGDTTDQPTTAKNAAFKQEANLNDDTKVDAYFAAAIAEAEEKIKAGQDAKVVLRDAIMKRAGHNAHLLAVYANKIGGKDMWADPNDWDSLVSDGYLSKTGEKLYYQIEGAMKQSGVQIALGEAPSNGYNSGISDGTFGAASSAGITGDRTAVIVTTPDNNSTIIMKRCGNIVYPSKPNLPEVPTDEPTPIPPTPPVIPPVSHHHHPTPKVEPKDPTEDVLVNKDVAGWKVNSDTQPLMTVDASSNGSSDSNALQVNPVKDAAAAEQAAETAADAAVDAADDAREEAVDSGAGVVDSGKGYDPVPNPTVIDPNW